MERNRKCSSCCKNKFEKRWPKACWVGNIVTGASYTCTLIFYLRFKSACYTQVIKCIAIGWIICIFEFDMHTWWKRSDWKTVCVIYVTKTRRICNLHIQVPLNDTPSAYIILLLAYNSLHFKSKRSRCDACFKFLKQKPKSTIIGQSRNSAKTLGNIHSIFQLTNYYLQIKDVGWICLHFEMVLDFFECPWTLQDWIS